MDKNLPANAGNTGSIPGLGTRSCIHQLKKKKNSFCYCVSSQLKDTLLLAVIRRESLKCFGIFLKRSHHKTYN